MTTNLRDQLQAIYDQHQTLDADLVVEEASSPEHPLHTRFEWDDRIAGPQYRREQARRLIRSCRIVYADDTAPVSSIRAFQHVRRTDGTGSYQPSEQVVQDPIATEIILRTMRREWLQMKNRYAHFQEFVQMVQGDLVEPGATEAADVG